MPKIPRREKIFIAGDQRLAATVAAALLLAGEEVCLFAQTSELFSDRIRFLLAEERRRVSGSVFDNPFSVADDVPAACSLVLLFLSEERSVQEEALAHWEARCPPACTIAISMDAALLNKLQLQCIYPARLLGMNWVEPAHITHFLEIITNDKSDRQMADYWCEYARENWNKVPYLLTNGFSIRGRLMAALIREALWLVDKGYVEREDIDRACRNDPGYYLPFSGHFQYMDMMGTFIYGIVMKDLNPSLSKDNTPPAFFRRKLSAGAYGMDTGNGFYEYKNGEARFWDDLLLDFSHQISDLMENYSTPSKKLS